jgi:replicative DNA helicase
MAASKDVQNRNLELGNISRGLKLAADALGAPVVAVHQLSRAVEHRADKRPLLSDLRESGRLEEDADVVLMLYREGYYNPSSPEADIAEIWIRKNRLGGPSGRCVRLFWQGKYMRFEALQS